MTLQVRTDIDKYYFVNSVNTYCFKLLYDIYWTLFIALKLKTEKHEPH